MKVNYKISVAIFFFILNVYNILFSKVYASENLKFKGVLVEAPCSLRVGDDNVILNFGSVVNKYLYENKRTKGEIFTIHLDDCDIKSVKGVNVTFLGNESSTVPGALSLDSTSTALGIVVGIETLNGNIIPVNTKSPITPITQTDTSLSYIGFLQAEPYALANNSIVEGAFTSSATFLLDYQ